MNESLPQSPKNDSTSSDSSIMKLVVGMMMGLFLLIGILMILDSLKVISLARLIPFEKKNAKPIAQRKENYYPVQDLTKNSLSKDAIGQVGEEVLYKADYDQEYADYPAISSRSKALIQEKLARDSIILQAAARDSLITLDASIYNSPSKEYQKRIEKVAEVEKIIDNKRGMMKGEAVSIWFYNPNASLEETARLRELANNKIAPLYEAIKAKEISLKDAGERLKNDTSLTQIDKNYKINAYVQFTIKEEKNIFTDSAVYEKVKKLSTGQLSELLLVKDRDYKTRGQREAGYIIVRVLEKKESTLKGDFSSWYAEREKMYEKKFY